MKTKRMPAVRVHIPLGCDFWIDSGLKCAETATRRTNRGEGPEFAGCPKHWPKLLRIDRGQ